MKTLKRTVSSVMVLFLLISSALFLMPAKTVAALTAVNSIESFITNDKWKAGTSWGNISPKLSKWSSSGCCAYCADYVAYCYGVTSGNPWSAGTKFTNVNDIKSGDVITLGNPNDGTGHWFVVVDRNGNSIRAAEGNVTVNNKKVVRIGWNYTISGSKFKEDPRAITAGYHYPAKSPDPAPVHATSANIKDGTYMLKNVASGYAMNWAYGESSNPLWLSKYGDEVDKEQHFKVSHTGSGKYKIESAHQSGKVVNCNCGLPVSAGVNVNVWSYSNNDTQKFYVTPMGNGQYLLQSASNPQLVIGAPSTSFHAKLEIQGYSKGDKKQLWSFDPNPAIPTYTVSASNVSNGKVSFSKTSAREGEEITITATPNAGYAVDTIKVNGTAISGKTFKMPAKNTTVEVTFKKVIYTITVSGTSNGTASVSRTTASIGDQITVTTNPAHGYELNSIKYNGTAINGNTFTMPAANVTVTVNFKRKDAPALGTTATVGNFIYKVTYAASDGTGTVTLTGVSTKTAAVSIPATVDINGYTYIVNRIGPNAFKNDKTIKTLYITANIRFIDNCAFYGCSNLVKVSGGAKLEIIGQSAFIYCTKLKTFVITSSVLKKIGPSAFYKDMALKTIYVKNTVKLTKSGVKKSLKGSKVKTVKVKKSKVKAYKKIFKKSNSGRKVKVKK